MDPEEKLPVQRKKPGRQAAVADDTIIKNVLPFGVLDEDGFALPLSDNVWPLIENNTTFYKGKIEISSVQTYLSQNRNGIRDKLREQNDILSVVDKEKMYSSLNKIDKPTFWMDQCNQLRSELLFSINISQENSMQMTPVTKTYADGRIYSTLQGPWTEIISYEIWKEKKMTCAWSFKRNKVFPDGNNSIYLRVEAQCTDKNCKVPLTAVCLEEPSFNDGFTMNVFTYDVLDIDHTRKQQCRGEARKVMIEKIANKKPGAIEEKESRLLMKSGDPESALIRNKKTYGKMLQEGRAAKLDLENPNDIVKSIMTKASLENTCIRSFSMHKFKLFYCTEDQLELWRTSYTYGFKNISIDSSGKFIRKIIYYDLENGHIFLYMIVIRFHGKITPLAQMLSARHDSLSIKMWLEDWLSLDIPIPEQLTTDNCLGLQYGACEACNKQTYKQYTLNNLKFLLKLIDTLPPCLLRLDIAHVMHACSLWNCLLNVISIVKDFYLKVIGFMSTLEDLTLFIQCLTAVFVVCESPNVDAKVLKYKNWLLQKLETYNVTDFLNEEEFENDELLQDLFNYETETPAFLEEMSSEVTGFINYIYDEAIKHKTTNGSKNKYQCPGFANNLKNLCKHFTSWTAVMVPFYKSADKVATSTGSENYFRFLRQVLQFSEPQSVILFYEQHLDSIIGRTNLTQAYVNKLILRRAQSQEEKMVESVDVNERGVHVKPQSNLGLLHSILEKNQASKALKQKGTIENANLSGAFVVDGKRVFLRDSGAFDGMFDVFVHAYNNYADFRKYLDDLRTNIQNFFLNAVHDYCNKGKRGFAEHRAKILYNIGDREGDVVNCEQNFETLAIKLLYNVCNVSVTQNCETCQIVEMQDAFAINNVDLNDKIVHQDLCLSDTNSCIQCNNPLALYNEIKGFFVLTFEVQALELELLDSFVKLEGNQYVLVGAVGRVHGSSNITAFCRHVKKWSKHDSIDNKFKKHTDKMVDVNFLLYVQVSDASE